MPQRQQPKQPPTTSGPLHAVPCPHCGKHNDLRELASQNLLDTGHRITCGSIKGDDVRSGYCGRIFQVTRIQPITIVQVRPLHQTPGMALRSGQPQPARTIGPRATRRLLGR